MNLLQPATPLDAGARQRVSGGYCEVTCWLVRDCTKTIMMLSSSYIKFLPAGQIGTADWILNFRIWDRDSFSFEAVPIFEFQRAPSNANSDLRDGHD
jgi:hypothetical protein